MNREQFDTDDEYFFALYLQELKEAKYIAYWKHEPYHLELTDGLKNMYDKKTILKTKTKLERKEQIILAPSVYTPDFHIVWEKISYNVFNQSLFHNTKIVAPFISYTDLKKQISVVELKPIYDSGNMTRLFRNNQKFIWDKHKVYVNLFLGLDDLFDKTFTPEEYKLTPKTKKPRKLKYIPKKLIEFLQ